MKAMTNFLANLMALIAVVAIAALAVPHVALAQDTGGGEDDWSFRLIPWLWTSSLTGDLGPSARPATVDLSFSDLLEMTEIGFTGTFDISYRDEWTLIAEGQYLALEESGQGPLGNNLTVDADMAIFGIVLAKRIWSGVDLYAGGRYFGLDVRVKSDVGLSPDANPNWIDPILGFRMKGSVSERVFVRLAMEFGGYGVNSDLTYGMAANFNYLFNDRFSLVFGYRMLDIDYDKDGFVFDAKMDGLLAGLAISW